MAQELGMSVRTRSTFCYRDDKLSEPRERHLPQLITLARNVFENSYNTIVQDQSLISQIIIDCTVLADEYTVELEDIEVMSRRLVYALHW